MTPARKLAWRGDAGLLLGLLLPPLIWGLQLGLLYGLVPYVCRSGNDWLFHAITALLLLAVSGCGVASWRARPDVSAEPAQDAITVSRDRFMAFGGAALAVGFGATMVLAWIPTLTSSPCG